MFKLPENIIQVLLCEFLVHLLAISKYKSSMSEYAHSNEIATIYALGRQFLNLSSLRNSLFELIIEIKIFEELKSPDTRTILTDPQNN